MDKSIPDKPNGDLIMDIGKLRQAIDVIDANILDLINERLLLAAQIGDLKKQSSLQVLDKQREAKIMDRLLDKNKGPVSDKGLRNIFGAIITESRNVQSPDEPAKAERKND